MRKCFAVLVMAGVLLCGSRTWAFTEDELFSKMLDARGATMLGDYEAAMSICDEVLAADPNFAEAYAVRSEVKYQQENVEGALEDAKKAIELAPESWDIEQAYFIRALIALDYASEPEQALEFINKAIDFTVVEPLPEYYELRAAIHETLGHKDLAEADLNRSDEIYAEMAEGMTENAQPQE